MLELVYSAGGESGPNYTVIRAGRVWVLYVTRGFAGDSGSSGPRCMVYVPVTERKMRG